jgi:hypothetical protein
MREVNSWAVIKEEKTPMFGRKLPIRRREIQFAKQLVDG